MYISAWQGLAPGHFFSTARERRLPFPFGSPGSSYFYRARNAIYHLFRALRLRNDEAVLVPDYHSGNEVWAIRAAGARLKYYPIRRDLTPDLDALDELLRSKPRVLFLIHYLGWPQPIREIQSLCRDRDIILVEDCALSMLSHVDGRPLGSFGDHSVFCLYKTLPLPNGGLLVQNGTPLPDLERISLRAGALRSVAGRCIELAVESLRNRYELAGRSLRSLKSAVGRTLNGLRVGRDPVGDIGFDLAQVDVAMSPVCHTLLKRFDYRQIFETRRRNYLQLRSLLAGEAFLLRDDLEDGVCPLFFPILVPDKAAAAAALQQHGIEAVQFWNYGDSEADGVGRHEASFLRRHVLELPIHQDITPDHIEYLASQVLKLKLRF